MEEIFGFIGVGRMGNPMATRLLNDGRKVCVFDSDAKAIAAMVALYYLARLDLPRRRAERAVPREAGHKIRYIHDRQGRWYTRSVPLLSRGRFGRGIESLM